MNIAITLVRHRWAEKAGFVLNRPQGKPEYILLHFLTPVTLTVGRQTQPADKGSFIVLSPETPHAFVAHGVLLHDWMHITGDMAALMQTYGLALNTLYHAEPSAGISEITAFLETEFYAQRPFWPQLAQAKLEELLIRTAHCLTDAQPQIRVRDETAERLRDLRAHILTEPWEAWSIEQLAEHVGISASRLYAVYKAVFGISPRHDLILIRIEKAKLLLLSGTSVADTAEQLGYGSVYHFIRQFKQLTGTTPKQYNK